MVRSSSLSNNPTNGGGNGGDDNEDSAFVDSFFLPGGIFDPDFETEDANNHNHNNNNNNNNNNQSYRPPAGLSMAFAGHGNTTTTQTSVPSNPWQALSTTTGNAHSDHHQHHQQQQQQQHNLSTSTPLTNDSINNEIIHGLQQGPETAVTSTAITFGGYRNDLSNIAPPPGYTAQDQSAVTNIYGNNNLNHHHNHLPPPLGELASPSLPIESSTILQSNQPHNHTILNSALTANQIGNYGPNNQFAPIAETESKSFGWGQSHTPPQITENTSMFQNQLTVGNTHQQPYNINNESTIPYLQNNNNNNNKDSVENVHKIDINDDEVSNLDHDYSDHEDSANAYNGHNHHDDEEEDDNENDEHREDEDDDEDDDDEDDGDDDEIRDDEDFEDHNDDADNEDESGSDLDNNNDEENQENPDDLAPATASSSNRSRSSVPLELLSIRGIYRGDSLTSSLSNSTCGSDHGEYPPAIPDIIDIHGEIEPTTINLETDNNNYYVVEAASEQAADHAEKKTTNNFRNVSKEKNKSSLLSASAGGENDDRKKQKKESIGLKPSANKKSRGATGNINKFTNTESTTADSNHNDSKNYNNNNVSKGKQQRYKKQNQQREQQQESSRIYQYWNEFCVAVSTWLSRKMASIRAFFELLGDIKDVLAMWVSQLFCAVRFLFVSTTKAVIVLVSLLLLIWKYALIQAMEENSVTLCYFVFYLMPNISALLMKFADLPHWTPHVISSASVFALCNQVAPGPLHSESSIFQVAESSSSTTTTRQTSRRGSSHHHHHQSRSSTVSAVVASILSTFNSNNNNNGNNSNSNKYKKNNVSDKDLPRDERACRTILKILRFVLPTFLVVDGFSSDFGTIMGVSGASRLTTAFMMSLVRKNAVSSPIGWISWAIQVLAATYWGGGGGSSSLRHQHHQQQQQRQESLLLDQFIFVVGLSSIRLIRYLESQRLQNSKRENSK